MLNQETMSTTYSYVRLSSLDSKFNCPILFRDVPIRGWHNEIGNATYHAFHYSEHQRACPWCYLKPAGHSVYSFCNNIHNIQVNITRVILVYTNNIHTCTWRLHCEINNYLIEMLKHFHSINNAHEKMSSPKHNLANEHLTHANHM